MKYIVYELINNGDHSHDLRFLREVSDPDKEGQLHDGTIIMFPRETLKVFSNGEPAELARTFDPIASWLGV